MVSVHCLGERAWYMLCQAPTAQCHLETPPTWSTMKLIGISPQQFGSSPVSQPDVPACTPLETGSTWQPALSISTCRGPWKTFQWPHSSTHEPRKQPKAFPEWLSLLSIPGNKLGFLLSTSLMLWAVRHSCPFLYNLKSWAKRTTLRGLAHKGHQEAGK
jgi:hypothetical protein